MLAYYSVNVGRNLWTSGGVCLIWGSLNRGFTVLPLKTESCLIVDHDILPNPVRLPPAVPWRLNLDIAASFLPTFPAAFYDVDKVKIALHK